MLEFRKQPEPALVEAIEEGRIVKVPEDYAKREGLLILRRHSIGAEKKQEPVMLKKRLVKDEIFHGIDDFRKPLRIKEGEIRGELVENFHWQVSQRRRMRKLTRKQVAEAVGETEDNLKLIENGILPANNFVLINKLESYLGLTLRKNKASDASALLQKIAKAKSEEKKTEVKEPDKGNADELLGKDIEVYFEE